ncbi:MAG: aminoglycoside phosphotransferase family protein [Clostridia bacterium]|nr:aminoglycoside phosphotransferase family protein [Clostridia bacterium]
MVHIEYEYDFEHVGKMFRLPGKFLRVETISGGLINRTYRVVYEREGGWEKSYLFQKINTHVFKKPEEVMENIDHVTTHIYKKRGGVNALHFHHTEDGKNYYVDEAQECFWRVRNYFDSVTFDVCNDVQILYLAGVAFGSFQNDLRDFDATLLHETIKDFHNTQKRLETLFADAELDPCGRVHEVTEELAYIKSVQKKACVLTEMLEAGRLPLRVTHNDTKINNVLFDPETRCPLTVIDLDTVMPGLVAHDFGDAVRFAANTAAEDEPDVSKISLDLEQFTAFAEGFVPCLKDCLTSDEINTLAQGVFCITVELASRFLDDYITGDQYFKTLYEGHNLVRARAQIALAKDIETKLEEMQGIVSRFCMPGR